MSAVMKEQQGNNQQLSDTVCNHIDHWVSKYPADQKQSAVLAALTAVQKENGGALTTQIMDAVADYLDMPKVAVYEVATFYSLFDLEKVGKYKINVCTNISCLLCGSKKIVSYLEQKLGITLGETTPDGKFTLRAVECLAACANAPMLQIGDTYYENLTPEKIDAILAEFN